MRINHNIAAMNTYNKLTSNNAATAKSLEKLSSGLKINRAGDNAAGLAISEKMRAQVRGLDQASTNAQDGISLIQTAEGGLNETHSILQRMRELAVQSANDTNTSSDRAEMQKEIDQLSSEITRISTSTEFNTKKLLNGEMGKIATKSGGSAVLTGLQATGASLTGGSSVLKIDDAGTNAETVTSGGSAITDAAFGTDAADITVGNGVLYGSYSLTVTSLSGPGGTANFELIGPDGTSTTLNGQDVDADVTIGGFTFDFGTQNVTKEGTLRFDLEATSIDLSLTGDATGAVTDMNYKGETLNVGGFEFTLKTGFGATNDTASIDVVDKAVKFHIGANADQNTSLSINDMSATALNVNSLDVTTQTGANSAITTIQSAIDKVSSERAKLGAMQNRLEHTTNNLTTSSENLSAAESRVRDVDMAKEMMEFQKNNILNQASTAMLAQANQQPQGVLQLLQ